MPCTSCAHAQLGNAAPATQGRSMLPWLLGGAVILGGTWFAVMLVRNGR
jgi:hypothetical protein